MTGTAHTIHAYRDLECKLGLERIKELLRRLGDPHKGIKYIHVAGTNGKGSVCRFIYTILAENGYKAGLFTSPHILTVNERIEYDGKFISNEDLESCADEVYKQAGEMSGKGFEAPTTFELLTAIAFLYYKKINAEYVILEVGLGGRGDATNIIENPLVSIITSISRDHMKLLGDTLPEIAAEKAGIFKEAAPVVSNVPERDAAEAIKEAAQRLNCAYYDVSGCEFNATKKTLEGYTFDANILGNEFKNVEIALIGRHQIQNAITAVAAIEIMRKNGHVSIKKENIYSGLLKTRHIGRFEILKENPYIIIDGAHNEKGAEELKNTIKEHFSGKRVLMVVGIFADKDVNKVLGNFYEAASDFIATEPDNPRKLSKEMLSEMIGTAGKNCLGAVDPVSACLKVDELSGEYDAVIFAGSLYLLGSVREYYL